VVLLLILVAVVLRAGGGVQLEPGSALVLDLSGEYVEEPKRPALANLFRRPVKPLVSLLSELAKVERDPRITSVILRIGDLKVGWGKAQEIRSAVEQLRHAGRRVVAYVEIEQYGSNVEYYVASAAEEIYLAPATRSPFAGLAAEYLFFGGLFEKLGVDVEYERIGRYKSAVESFGERAMSEPSREMANSLLDSIESQFVSAIAQGRGLTPTRVREIIDEAPATAAELEASGLVDGVSYFDELVTSLGDPPLVEDEDWARVDAESLGFSPEATLALVYGTGPVVVGEGATNRSGDPVLASRTVSEALRDAADDSEIDGIVFRVDSPGGSALASDLVWHAVEHAQEAGKPVIVSFSDVAASAPTWPPRAATTWRPAPMSSWPTPPPSPDPSESSCSDPCSADSSTSSTSESRRSPAASTPISTSRPAPSPQLLASGSARTSRRSTNSSWHASPTDARSAATRSTRWPAVGSGPGSRRSSAGSSTPSVACGSPPSRPGRLSGSIRTRTSRWSPTLSRRPSPSS
jgi:ClpP class serine protease